MSDHYDESERHREATVEQAFNEFHKIFNLACEADESSDLDGLMDRDRADTVYAKISALRREMVWAILDNIDGDYVDDLARFIKAEGLVEYIGNQIARLADDNFDAARDAQLIRDLNS